MEVIINEKFTTALRKLKNPQVDRQVLDIVENVLSAQSLRDIRQIKKLKGSKSAYRIRVQDYRIGIIVENDVVEFIDIGHRKNIYNRFPPKNS